MDALATVASDSDNLLSPEEAASRLRCSAVTLARWRSDGTGPDWHRIGPRRVAYRSSDVERFIGGVE